MTLNFRDPRIAHKQWLCTIFSLAMYISDEHFKIVTFVPYFVEQNLLYKIVNLTSELDLTVVLIKLGIVALNYCNGSFHLDCSSQLGLNRYPWL